MSLPIPEWGLVDLNSIELDAPGRLTLNSYVLTDGAPRRRKNRVRPGVDGELGAKGFKTPRTVQLEVFLDGRWDYLGAPATDPVAAVESHYLYLRQQILDDDGDDEGAVTCTVSSAIAGVSYQGLVQVDDLVHQPGIGAQVITFDLVLLRGELASVLGSV